MIRLPVVGVVFALCCFGQRVPTGNLIQTAAQELYLADFAKAAADFGKAEAADPSDPTPACLLGLTDLWRLVYFGYDATIAHSLGTNADRAVQKAERAMSTNGTKPGEAYFWRGLAESLRIAAILAPRALQSERRQFDIESLMAGISTLVAARSAESDFTRALGVESTRPDARVMLILFQQCRSANKAACIASLWSAADDGRWIGTEVKYILLNLVYGQRTMEAMRSRGAPLAIELHGRYPSNGLFHLALAKVSYEIGDHKAAEAYCAEIVSAPYGAIFGAEAKYLRGLTACDDSDWQLALAHFMDVINASPRSPAYLMPWSLLRAAQCEEALRHYESALSYARKALAVETQDAKLRSAAERVIMMVNAERPR